MDLLVQFGLIKVLVVVGSQIVCGKRRRHLTESEMWRYGFQIHLKQ